MALFLRSYHIYSGQAKHKRDVLHRSSCLYLCVELNVQPLFHKFRSMGIYLDTINIFIRILSLLAGSGNKKR